MKLDRILIVEDKEEGLYFLRTLLEAHGFEVDDARHGAEALDKARQNPPSLVISDLLMPGMDGYTLLRHWRAEERLKAIPFVVYTATYTEEKDERFALDLGADAFIRKPMEPEPFMERIHDLLAKAKSGTLPAASPRNTDEGSSFKAYSEVLIHKLEEKALQLEEANRVLETDIAERKRVEEALRASLHEKEVLLREIHHRVKNNMQVISSLLSLKAASIQDPLAKEVIKESQVRIRSMALVHERLYSSSDLAHVDFADYLRNLYAHLGSSFSVRSDRISVHFDLDDFPLDINTAVPCGLIATELISNAMKHAFPGGRTGTITVSLKREGAGRVRLSVSDDGIGLPSQLDYRNTESMGMQIVNMLVEQIDGRVDLAPGPGTRVSVTFPEDLYRSRI
jgi:two-component sensor histidine kinase/CheY-like chemotaxis protein